VAYEEGVAHFEAGRFDEALEAFTEAYNTSEKADLLYNLAVCCERLGHTDRAVAYYELYLEELPDAEDADSVRGRIEALSGGGAATEEEAAPGSEAAQPGPEPAEAEAEREAGADEEIEVVEEVEEIEEDLIVEEVPEPEDEGIFWPGAVVGVGALLLAGGTLTAILAYNEYTGLEETCSPDCTDDQVSSVRELAVASDVQLALGGAAAFAGIIWWAVEATADSERDIAALRVAPAPLGSAGGVVAEGRF